MDGVGDETADLLTRQHADSAGNSRLDGLKGSISGNDAASHEFSFRFSLDSDEDLSEESDTANATRTQNNNAGNKFSNISTGSKGLNGSKGSNGSNGLNGSNGSNSSNSSNSLERHTRSKTFTGESDSDFHMNSQRASRPLLDSDNDVSYKVEADMVSAKLEATERRVKQLENEILALKQSNLLKSKQMKQKCVKKLSAQASKQMKQYLRKVYIQAEQDAQARAEERWRNIVTELESTIISERKLWKSLAQACDEFLEQRGF
ncbi:hypothetical protein DASB73_037440 [Starmerella bacillaris]|uniref:Uncharacterized protein n=1 Tax=Starmerella bacillaris TaxID=1247836 RepID=A0AAV5RQ46_STABA|nr:hypothetical protein DASB73_037440 [Starmerella bacillaris]